MPITKKGGFDFGMKTKTEKRDTGSEKGHFSVDIIAKILCVFAAFCLWIYVMQVESPEYSETFSHVVVELINTEDLVSEKELAIYNGYGTMIDVTLSGKKSVISKLTDKDIIATADVSSVKEGGNRYDCKINVDVPAGCKLEGISQETISVYLDKATQVALDLVELRENANLPDDCYMGLIDFPVDKVTVNGPEKVVGNIDRAVVAVDLSGITSSTTVTQKIYLADKNGGRIDSPYVTYYPSEVTFNIPIFKKVDVPIEVEFKNGYLNSGNTYISVDPSSVEVTGDPKVIDAGNLISPVIIDEKTDFTGSVCKKNVYIKGVDGVTLNTAEAKVSIQINNSIKTRQITIPGKNIVDTGAKKGVEYTWNKSPVTVTVMGELYKITDLTPDDITLCLDMSPYTETNTGTIKVKAEVIIDSAYKNEIWEIGTYEIDVTFTGDQESS